ncbi:MAG: transposase [Candidatus Omnitrophota bacterium]
MALIVSYAKRERVNYKGATHHIVTRCNNKKALIVDDFDFAKYKSILRKAKEKYGFLLHNYALMNNHVHLIIRLREILDISKIMHSINRQYARWHNEHYDKKGHFWENRFYGELIEDDVQLLAVMRYIDLNPVKAGLCEKPVEWKHSGAGCYLQGKQDRLIDAPEVYTDLGKTEEARQRAYSYIFPFK